MVDPLVTGIRSARTVEKSGAERTYEERLAQSTSGGRFERTQSVEARAFERARTKKNVSNQNTEGILDQGRRFSNERGVSRATKKIRAAEEKIATIALTAQYRAGRLREFSSLAPRIVWVDALIIPFSIIGLLLLFFSDTTAGAVASFIVSAVTFGTADLKLAGMLFIGLSMCIAFVSYVGMLVYMIFRHNIRIIEFTGWYYIAAIVIPVAGVVPGFNIAPWFTLWTFLLLTAPKPT